MLDKLKLSRKWGDVQLSYSTAERERWISKVTLEKEEYKALGVG